MNRHFTFKLKDDIIRGMNREQYYSVMHWLRYTAREVRKAINWDKFHKHITDSFVYGNSIVCFEDLLI